MFDDILDCSLHSVEIHRADNDRFWQDSTYRAYGERLLADHPERRRDFRSSFRPRSRSRSPASSDDDSSHVTTLDFSLRHDRQQEGCEHREQCERLENKLEILRKEHKVELNNLECKHRAERLASKKEVKEIYQELLDSKDECIASLRSEIKAKDEMLAFCQQRLNEIEDDLSR